MLALAAADSGYADRTGEGLLSNRHRFGNQLPCKMAGIGLPASSSMMP